MNDDIKKVLTMLAVNSFEADQERLARAEAAESERDRQYEFNAGMIAKLAAAESQVAALTGHLAKMKCPVCRESLGRPHSEFWKDCSDCEEQRAALSRSKEATLGKGGTL